MNTLRLRDDVWLQLDYRDTTPHGSALSGRMEAGLAARLEPLVSPLIEAGWCGVDHAGLCRAVAEATADLRLADGSLRDEVLYPDPSLVVPETLVVHTAAGELGRVALPEGAIADLADTVGAWQQGRGRPGTPLFDAMAAMGAFTPAPALPLFDAPGITWVGHACARVAGQRTRVLVDPFLPAHAAAGAYRPLSLSQLGANLVLVTHSHPDHCDWGTLLRLGADCDIVVPCVPRESALSIDMAARLRQLGFRRVRALAWHESLTLGDATVCALPFHGKQAGDGERLHPEVRNVGNLYTVQTASHRVAFAADAGQDAEGDLRRVAEADRRDHGPVDLLFAGCRAGSLYPAQLLRGSIRRHALFIPAAQWTRRHRPMAGLDEALDAAERWGARRVVPYADGGAPWYWSLGLGPDASQPPGSGTDRSDAHFDPRPEALARAARSRSSWGGKPIASPVAVLILRPGESLIGRGDALRPWPVTPAQRWPCPRVDVDDVPAEREEEVVAVGRKKALLRVLAGELATLRGIEVTPAEVQALSDHVRRAAGLSRRDDMLDWLERTNLSIDEFSGLMQEWARCNALESAYAHEIDRRLPGQLALHAMRNATAHARRSA